MESTTSKIFALLLSISLATALGACELESEYEDSDLEDGADLFGADGEEAVQIPDYRYVRIDDLSAKSNTVDGGADIDAVILNKHDGRIAFGVDVKGFAHGGGKGDDLDPMKALGAPDAFYKYFIDDLAVCDVDNNEFVSLGGNGGFLVLEMGDVIESGDVLTVLEVGGCEYDSAGHEAIVEPVMVSISVSSDLYQPYWVQLGSKEGPEISFSIPALSDPGSSEPPVTE